jgi:hypothetical protein
VPWAPAKVPSEAGADEPNEPQTPFESVADATVRTDDATPEPPPSPV